MRLVVVFILWLLATSVFAQETSKSKLSFSGDFRGRVELDRDSRKSDGTFRHDRDRARLRLRFGINYQYSDRVTLGGRIRTGSPDSPQSPHATLGNELRPKSVSLDRAFARVSTNKGFFWFGKNAFPFWKQNELFWDDDVSPEGFAGSYNLSGTGRVSVRGTGGYFFLDNPASNEFSDQSRMIAGQLVLSGKSEKVDYTIATGLYLFTENPDQKDVHLDDLDYQVGVISANASFKDLKYAFSIGLDIMSNLENYDSALFNREKTHGYVAGITVGSLRNQGDWQMRYYYANIEKYAVVARYAQDDWMRWGSSTVTRASNFKGHEFRFSYALGAKHNLVARLYSIDGIEKESAAAIAKESGTRFRIDWNIGF